MFPSIASSPYENTAPSVNLGATYTIASKILIFMDCQKFSF